MHDLDATRSDARRTIGGWAWFLVGVTEVAIAGRLDGSAAALLAAWAAAGWLLRRQSPWLPIAAITGGSLLLVVEARGVGLILAAVGVVALGWVGRGVRRWPRTALFLVVPTVLAAGQLRGVKSGVHTTIPSVPAGTRRVLLLTVDTLRADVALPTFQALAARGRTGPAWSTSAWTVPALGSALTGASPAAHGAVVRPPLRGETRIGTLGVPTVAEMFQAAGWRTLAVVENPQISPERGFHRGFDVWDHVDFRRAPRSLLLDPFGVGMDGRPLRHHGRDEDERIDRAIALLSSSNADTFLWVHLLGPHLPYPSFEPGGALEAMQGPDARGVTVTELRTGRLRRSAPVEAELRATYTREALRADAAMGRLIAAAGPDAAVVYTADHGEALGEHGGWEHGHTLYEELVRVPLALAAPGVAPGTWTAPASLLDVTPTLLGLSGLNAPSTHVGVDLRAEPPARILPLSNTLYGEELEGALDWPFKYTREANGRWETLIELQRDPRELADLCPIWPERCAALRAAVEAEQAQLGETPTGTIEAAVRALGYAE